MSTNREDFGVKFEVTAGTSKTLTATLIDPDTGLAQDMSDTNVFNSGVVKIYKPDGTQIGTDMAINFYDRDDGIIKFTISGLIHATNANAGNWIGEIEISNITPLVVDQQKFNISIIESF